MNFAKFAMSASHPRCRPPDPSILRPLEVPQKTLLGPGPSNCPPRILAAAARPVLGHLHGEFVKVMTDLQVSAARAQHGPSTFLKFIWAVKVIQLMLDFYPEVNREQSFKNKVYHYNMARNYMYTKEDPATPT